MTTLPDLQRWMDGEEDEHVEFKEAKEQFRFEELKDYCVALANEGGGHLVLGVSDKRPRKVVGSRAFLDLTDKKKQLLDALHFRVDADEIEHPGGRVVVFRIPSRPIGEPRHINGRYLMRSGSSLVPMTPERLREIVAESAGPDYSAQTLAAVTFADLDPAAIERFRALRVRKTGDQALRDIPSEQLMADAELTVDGRITLAALVLLGTPNALSRHLAQAELIYEYRGTDDEIASRERAEYRAGFFTWDDALWARIDQHNVRQELPDALVLEQIRTFNEQVVRELLLNAVAHRDYRDGGSIVVRQYPLRLEVVSPGGFLQGISAENVLHRHRPRNRRIAEALQHCGVVERSGQGYDRIFRNSIEEAKDLPDFTGTDTHQVSVTVHGAVRDPRFVFFLRRLTRDRGHHFSVDDLLVLDRVHRGQPISEVLRQRVGPLRDQGVLETVGKGRSQKVLLSREFHAFLGNRAEYTRRKGLDGETNKALLRRHIVDNAASGSPIQELTQVLPSLSRGQVKTLLQELRAEGTVELRGKTKGGRWYPTSTTDDPTVGG